MTTSIMEESNAALRRAVQQRLDNMPQVEPDVLRPVTKPRHLSETDDVSSQQPVTVAERTLQGAIEAVRDRHTKYGPPVEHFSRTAALVNAAFGTNFTPADWALVMVLDKVARLRGPTPTTDGGIDIAGYGSCYEECRSCG